jgi:nucleoside 2-deoxyribosyltransferase
MMAYLAGPINGCTDDESKNWREEIKSILGEENCLDPMRSDYRGREDECVDEIVEKDKADIYDSDVVIANCWQVSWGTAMEILFAWNCNVPVIAIVPKDARISPWLCYHTIAIVHCLDDAITTLVTLNYLGNMV